MQPKSSDRDNKMKKETHKHYAFNKKLYEEMED